VPVVDIEVPVPVAPEPTAHMTAEQIVSKAKRARTDGERSFYSFGVYLKELRTPARMEELGCKTFEEVLQKHALTNRMTANRLISIVDELSPETAASNGMSKSYAIVRYVEAAGLGERAERVWLRNPMVEVRPGTRARLWSLAAADVYEAIRSLFRRDVPDALVRRAQRATRGISQRLEHLGIESARARSVQRRRGMVVRVEVDATEAEELLALLGRG
jgi:hypothetical protein